MKEDSLQRLFRRRKRDVKEGWKSDNLQFLARDLKGLGYVTIMTDSFPGPVKVLIRVSKDKKYVYGKHRKGGMVYTFMPEINYGGWSESIYFDLSQPWSLIHTDKTQRSKPKRMTSLELATLDRWVLKNVRGYNRRGIWPSPAHIFHEAQIGAFPDFPEDEESEALEDIRWDLRHMQGKKAYAMIVRSLKRLAKAGSLETGYTSSPATQKEVVGYFDLKLTDPAEYRRRYGRD